MLGRFLKLEPIRAFWRASYEVGPVFKEVKHITTLGHRNPVYSMAFRISFLKFSLDVIRSGTLRRIGYLIERKDKSDFSMILPCNQTAVTLEDIERLSPRCARWVLTRS